MNDQQNIQSETPVEYNTNLNSLNEYEKPKKNPTGGIIILLLFLVILGLTGKIAYDRGYLDKVLKKEKTETKEEIKKDNNIKETKSEKEITDKATIDKINEKANVFEFTLIGDEDLSNRLASISKYLFSKPELTKTISYDECVTMGAGCEEYKDNIKGDIKLIDYDVYLAEYEKIFGKTEELYGTISSLGLFVLSRTSTTEKDDLVGFELKEPTDRTTIVNYYKKNEKYTEDENYYYKYYNLAIEADGYFFYGLLDYQSNSLVLSNTSETIKYYTELLEQRKNININQVDSQKLSYVKEYYKKVGDDFIFEKAILIRE